MSGGSSGWVDYLVSNSNWRNSMIVHDVYLQCDKPGCTGRIFLKSFEHKRQISVRDLRKLAEPCGWVTRMGQYGEVSYCPQHKGCHNGIE